MMDKDKLIMRLSILTLLLVIAIPIVYYFENNPEQIGLKEREYPIEEGNLRCNEVYKEGKLFERTCRNKDSFKGESNYLNGESMEPSIYSGDLIYYREVEEDEGLMFGAIYVYNKNETSDIAHRLIGDCDDDTLIFKGDNNPYADDPVDREKILYEVIGECRDERYC